MLKGVLVLREQHDQFWEIIEILHEASALPHVMIIGSWAEYLYQESGTLADYKTNFKTRDLDLLIPNIRKPREAINLPNIFKEHDYIIDYAQDGQIKIFRSPALELEFLVTEKGRGQIEPYITHLGVKAVGLRSLSLLMENKIPLTVKHFIINVPTPEAYVLHKMMINPKRSVEKQEKDTQSIMHLVNNHYKNNKELMDKLLLLYKNLSHAEKKKVNEFCYTHFLDWLTERLV